MTTFAFNKLYILESLSASEFQSGTELGKRINSWVIEQGIECQAITFQVHSMQEWENVWNGIYTSIETLGIIPAIHLEMHGNKSTICIDGGTNGTIPLNNVFQKVQHANILSKNNVFLSLDVCIGLNAIRNLKVYEPMPFCGIMGSLETLNNDEHLDIYTIFYKAFLTTLNLDKAERFMIDSGIDTIKYEIFKPEQIFVNAYLGYLETYKTDEQIEEKAIAAAKNTVIFENADEKNRFVRDYKCSLFLTENIEYQRAVNTFFCYDSDSSFMERFVIPKDVYKFKKQVRENSNNSLVKRRILTVDDIKGVSLQILHAVDTFCKENQIQYSLAYGTLLGAVRHHGFIPWDDDIDICMLRSDYDKFIATFNRDEEKTFSVASFETDSNFRYPFAKIVCNSTIKDELGYSRYGLGIDLFPIDKIPTSKDKANKLIKRQLFIWKIFMLKSMKFNKNRNVLKNLTLLLVKPFVCFIPYSQLQQKMRRSAMRYSSLDDQYNLGCLYTPYGCREIMSKKTYEKVMPILFENYSFKGLKEYDIYLKNLYGDYLQLPPKENQITHHDFLVYWK